jgi:monomeric isocitrate dehydrogenase
MIQALLDCCTVVQGVSVDVGGYYKLDEAKAEVS